MQVFVFSFLHYRHIQDFGGTVLSRLWKISHVPQGGGCPLCVQIAWASGHNPHAGMWQAVGLRPCEFPACLLVTSGWQPHCAMEVSQLLLAGSASTGFHHDRCVGVQEVGKGRQVHESLALPPCQMVVTSPQLPHCWSLSPPSWGLAEMGAGYSGRSVVSALPLPSPPPPHEACGLTTLPQPRQLGLQKMLDARLHLCPPPRLVLTRPPSEVLMLGFLRRICILSREFFVGL